MMMARYKEIMTTMNQIDAHNAYNYVSPLEHGLGEAISCKCMCTHEYNRTILEAKHFLSTRLNLILKIYYYFNLCDTWEPVCVYHMCIH
jgi:hypothetical protein